MLYTITLANMEVVYYPAINDDIVYWLQCPDYDHNMIWCMDEWCVLALDENMQGN